MEFLGNIENELANMFENEMFLERHRIPDKLKEMILSRAHLH
jgi:hypothetical protein